MTQDNLIEFKPPPSRENFSDSLTELVRQGARQIITQAVEAELTEFLDQHQALRTESGHQGVVRNGYLPERSITTGVGEVLVQVPKVRDRTGSGLKFNSLLLPPYLKRSRSVEEVLPWLYLKGLSTGDFSEALHALLGTEAKGLSAASGDDQSAQIKVASGTSALARALPTAQAICLPVGRRYLLQYSQC